jgi:hypothetical protein
MPKKKPQKKTPSKPIKPVRTRLEPEVRKELILDAAADLVAEEGVSAVSMERLSAEPSVADHGDPTEYNRSSAVNNLADILHNNYDLELDLAKAVLDISFGLPAAGGHYLIREGTDRELVEDTTVTMIMGSIQAVLDKYGTSRKKLNRKLQVDAPLPPQPKKKKQRSL